MHLILLCRSLTRAQKAARTLQNAGLFAAVTKAPQSENPGGCTYGVKIAERDLPRAEEALDASEIRIDRVVTAPERPWRGDRR